MKRQIIKTRPRAPYVVARVVIIAIIVIVALALAWALWKRSRQDFDFAVRNTQTPPTVAFASYEHLY